jgi:hypothetical protein
VAAGGLLLGAMSTQGETIDRASSEEGWREGGNKLWGLTLVGRKKSNFETDIGHYLCIYDLFNGFSTMNKLLDLEIFWSSAF